MSKATISERFIDFVNRSPSSYHTVANCTNFLNAHGFEFLDEKDDWKNKINRGGKYYTLRANTSIIAFAVGGRVNEQSGFAIAASHTDFCCLKVKPKSKIIRNGYSQMAVAPYGGGRWTTWFDRDLSLAGSMYVRGPDKRISEQLVHIENSILRIPTLAIHLETQRDTFECNKENHLLPILGAIEANLNDNDSTVATKHGSQILNLVKKSIAAGQEVVDFDLNLYDTQQGCLAGINDEFVVSQRIDNTVSVFCTTIAMIESLDSLLNDSSVRVIAGFDHEEVGSESAQGAHSNLLNTVLVKISNVLAKDTSESTAFQRMLRLSILLNTDMAHALHPNYVNKYDPVNYPMMNEGVVLKTNANQRYMTDARGRVYLQTIADSVNVPLQDFAGRNDVPCGSTTGPILAQLTGIPTIDVGISQLAMHSIREICGSKDMEYYVLLIKAVFEQHATVFANTYCNNSD